MRGACGRFHTFPPLPKKTPRRKANPDESVASFSSEHACVELTAVSMHFHRYPKEGHEEKQTLTRALRAFLRSICMRGACGHFHASPQCTHRRTKIRHVWTDVFTIQTNLNEGEGYTKGYTIQTNLNEGEGYTKDIRSYIMNVLQP